MGKPLVVILQELATVQIAHVHANARPAVLIFGDNALQANNWLARFFINHFGDKTKFALFVCNRPSATRIHIGVVGLNSIGPGVGTGTDIGTAARSRYIVIAGRVSGGQIVKDVCVDPLAAEGISPIIGSVVGIEIKPKVFGTGLTAGVAAFANVPVCRRNFPGVHPGLPLGIQRGTRRTATIVALRSPFAHKNRQAFLHCEIRIRGQRKLMSLIAIGPPCIVMERIGNIIPFQRVFNVVINSLIRVLVPHRRPHDNQVVGILANHRNHLVGIGLDVVHANKSAIFTTIAIVTHGTRSANRLVEHLKNHVVIFAPFFRLNPEKGLRVLDTVRRHMGMEVDNHVDIVLYRSLHGLIQHGLVENGLCKIVTISPLAHVVYRHGGADQLDILPFHKPRNDILFPVPLLICSTTPEKAHALHLDFVSAGTEMFTAAVDPALAGIVRARLQLAVLAHGANTQGSDFGVGGGEKAQGERTQGKEFGEAEL